MSFHVGQHVVCIDMTPRLDGLDPRYPDTVVPVLGGTYTVRDVFDAGPYGYDAEAGILLVEVVNPVRPYISKCGPVECEQFWLAFRFRPVCRTNIEVFEKMLVPVPQEPAELVDA
jgi:hypothetical protein